MSEQKQQQTQTAVSEFVSVAEKQKLSGKADLNPWLYEAKEEKVSTEPIKSRLLRASSMDYFLNLIAVYGKGGILPVGFAGSSFRYVLKAEKGNYRAFAKEAEKAGVLAYAVVKKTNNKGVEYPSVVWASPLRESVLIPR